MSIPANTRVWFEAGDIENPQGPFQNLIAFDWSPWVKKSVMDQQAYLKQRTANTAPSMIGYFHPWLLGTKLREVSDPTIAKPGQILQWFEAGFIDVKDEIDYTRQVYDGAPRPALEYVDMEYDPGTWGMPPELVRTILASKNAKQYMPAMFRNMDPNVVLEYWNYGQSGRDAITAWNGFASDLVVRSLKVWAKAVNPDAKLVIAFRTRPRWPISDYNGWPCVAQDVSVTNWEMYGTSAGQKFNNSTDRDWSCLVDDLNIARANTDTANGVSMCPHLWPNIDRIPDKAGDPVKPMKQVQPPVQFIERWKHFMSMQQPSQKFRDIFIFNQFCTPERNAWMMQNLPSLVGGIDVRANIPRVLDTSRVVGTGSVTTYKFDYRAQLDKEKAL